ncbi:MAG: NosD domain-containing protein, partial [Planctomycetota bacterium]|nr:NosD domain-containing protein [Planctomycetota bacterium]
MLFRPIAALLALVLPQASEPASLPLLVLTEDDTIITASTRVRIPEGTVIRDSGGDGVIQIAGERIQVVFEKGSVLRGAGAEADPDSFTGVGLRVIGQRDVRIEGLHVRGYQTGIFATRTAGLQISHADVSDNFSQRLASTPEACDDGADWLACHANDNGEWRRKYGAGIYVEDSSAVVVRDSRARRTQNGLLFDRVTNSAVYDNDFSFLSGWGLGLWRSSKNRVSRNAFDFCIRGYSHGKYNRGQDSAGILVFEQCNDNVFAHNSATHGGDGVFGFAGSEALGQHQSTDSDFDATGLGNNRNLFVGNDLSYAAAHGLEMTFSFDNVVLSNRFVGNAICGFWGGYSQSTLIGDNLFEANGDAGYGQERGGINIEHSVRNRISQNRFARNACGVHMWWDEDKGLMSTPWAQANETGCVGNEITDNVFERDQVAIELRACQPVTVAGNRMNEVGTELAAEEGATRLSPRSEGPILPHANGTFPGKNQPVGARQHLAGRDNILMGEWGPWDHEAPFLQAVDRTPDGHIFALHNFPARIQPEWVGEGLTLKTVPGDPVQLMLS